MPQNLDDFTLIAALLMNWDGIRLRMEPISPALADELSQIAEKLQNTVSSDEVAIIVDDLLDLTRGTAAYAYVQGLVARSEISEISETSGTRDYDEAEPREVLPPGPDNADVLVPVMETGRVLGTLMSVDSDIGHVPIFFATNRGRTSQAETPFNGEPASEISYGVVTVTIPVSKHKIGRVESPHWWTLFPDTDKEQRFVTLGGLEILTQPKFATRLEALLRPVDVKDLLIFLHGYNVTFEEGARRAAQIAWDMKFPGVVILFSWPSAGSAKAYPNDEERAIASADRFAAFLKSLEGGPWNRVHIVAHSMGNRVMLLGLADNARPKLPLGQIVFTAADVYVPLFQEKFPKLQEVGRLPATSYASSRDLALRLSSWLHRGARVGLISGEPFVTLKLDTIDASAVDTGFLGHGYFADERSLITDLRLLIYRSMRPEERGLTRTRDYWLFPK